MDLEREIGLELTLRPVIPTAEHDSNDDQASISALLHRIGRQRGSFRNFTEQSLLEELTRDVVPPALAVEPDEQEQKESGPEEMAATKDEEDEDRMVSASKKEEDIPAAQKLRDEVLGLVGIALNEAALALDFTSLLLSSTKQAAAQSMSPALKEAVPVGSLAQVRVRRKVNQHKDMKQTILGYRAQGLSQASSILRTSGTDTVTDHESETVFWNELAALLEAGWPIFRRRPTGVGLAIRFGSGPRQFIAAEKDEQGHIDTSKLAIKDSFLVFTLRRHDKVVLRIDSRDAAETLEKLDVPAIVGKLTRIRKSILVNTTFDQLVKESRECANQGFTIRERLILIPLHESVTVGIELVEQSVAGGTDDEEGPVTEAEDAEMSGTESSSSATQSDKLLLSALQTIVHLHDGKTGDRHCLRSFVSWFAHGLQASRLHSTLERIIRGLHHLSWSSFPVSLQTLPTAGDGTSSVDALQKNTQTSELISFLSSEVMITLATSKSGIAHYTLTGSTTQVPGLPGAMRTLKTHSLQQVLALVHFIMNEALMAYLSSRNPSIIRCAEEEVRTEAGRVVILITEDGVIYLISPDKSRKQVQDDIVLEICDESGYDTTA